MTSEAEYPNPVDQVMFILGFKHDPKFPTRLHAVVAGASPGLTDAAEEVSVYGAIHGNFMAISKVLEAVRAQSGGQIPARARHEMHKLILEQLTEDQYGGRWFPPGSVPQHWVSLGEFSEIFTAPEGVFCLPAPYVRLLSEVF
ncbi:MAG TPA: hypothetical protein VLC46_25795 [Thermoanaerobaculia bacterium]|jgi:hypothetical protein|nr:hypothetical protein [Thermoanaerobaculia bacterium]